MSDVRILILSEGSVDQDTGVPMVTAFSGTGNERKPYGRIPMLQSLGLSALPAAPSNDNQDYCEGVAIEGLAGKAGVIAGRDARSGKVIAELGEGETCLHSTGEDFNSRVFCKYKMVSIIVDDDTTITIDKAEQTISILGFGHAVEISKDNGIVLAEEGGAALILKGGQATLKGKIALGEGACVPVACGGVGVASVLSSSILVPPV